MNDLLPRLLPLLVPLVVIAIVLRRAVRGRKVRVERLWIVPAIAFIGGIAVLATQRDYSPLILAVEAIALVLGGALGWWRGAFTRLTVDATTHEVTSKASAAGIALVLTAFLVRYAARAFLRDEAGGLHISATLITDGFLMFAVGVILMQRLEIWLRCTRMIAEARAKREDAAPTA